MSFEERLFWDRILVVAGVLVAWRIAVIHDRRVEDVDGIYRLVAKHRKEHLEHRKAHRKNGTRRAKYRILTWAHHYKLQHPDAKNILVRLANTILTHISPAK